MSFICLVIGFIGGIVLSYATDKLRVKRLLEIGYDNAVRDIIEYGCYYNKSNERIAVVVMTKEDKFEIGLTLNKIALLLSDEDFHKVKDLLKHVEKIVAKQEERSKRD